MKTERIEKSSVGATNQKMQKLPSAPVSKSTKRDQNKTSVGFTVLAIVLYILAFVPIIVAPIALAIHGYELAPYYSFWHFVGVIIGVVFAIIYTVVVVVVSRKKTKSDIKAQTVKIAIAFTCLTCVFGLLLTYVVPDVIAMATQGTLFTEDLYYNGASQTEHNISLERDFIMYNLLNGNLNTYNADGSIAENGDFSYKTLAKHQEDQGIILSYDNQDIQTRYDVYSAYASMEELQRQVIDTMKDTNSKKYELYEFIYTNYILNDYDYAFNNSINRRAFALSIIDYLYSNFDYEGLLKEGWNNARLKALYVANYENFKQDGYNTFDDPLLLYAQMEGRMTIPVVLRLILNDGWTYSQSSFNEYGTPTFTEDGNCLYQLYDPKAKEDFENDGGSYDFVGTLMDGNGNEIQVRYGFNKDGWMIFENGVTKRPMNWLVLDMLGDPMALTTLDLKALAGDMIAGVVQNVINMLPTLVDSLGTLIQDELINNVVVEATGGAKLQIGLCIDNDGNIAINLFPMNAQYGMVGYMQATWMESNNLLMAVINVIGLRNWYVIFGAVGLVLVILAGVIRECGKNTRERTEKSRFRISRELAKEGVKGSAGGAKSQKATPKQTQTQNSKPAPKKDGEQSQKKTQTKQQTKPQSAKK